MGLRAYFYLILVLSLSACSESFLLKKNNNASSIPETSYCPGTATISGNTTLITATAQFRRYDDGSSGLVSTSVNNIRYAEVQILDSAGNLVQCGETDSNGAIGSTSDMSGGTHSSPGLYIPRSAGSYTVRINSRGDNSFVKASILNNPTNNVFYSTTGSFSLTGVETTSAVTIAIASHTGTLEGGAFNILDQIYIANNYLRLNSTCSFCTTFTVAPKATVYWTPGLSPGTYYGSPTTGISFYNRYGSSGFPNALYMLGGISGSVCTDTDHFDNSVILHEYGHFLEHQIAATNSPGGSHNGNSIIDPRLAWSEGFSNFIQGKMLGRNFYRDTVGNLGCGNAALAFTDFRLDTQVAGQDIPTNSGEGTFREFATSRALYSTATSYGFQYLWSAFSDLTYGLKNATFHFRNPSLFFKQLYYALNNRAALSMTSYNSAMTTEQQANNSLAYYAYPTAARLSSCHTTDANYTFTTGSPVQQSNVRFQSLSNRFFQYDFDGSNTNAVIYLYYTATTSTYGSVPYDLDLTVYNEDYVFLDASTVAGVSDNYYPEAGGYEVVNLSGKPAGTYMINISAYVTATKDTTQFYLITNSGKYLCP